MKDDDDSYQRDEEEDTLLSITVTGTHTPVKSPALPQMSILYVGLLMQITNLCWCANNVGSKHLLEE